MWHKVFITWESDAVPEPRHARQLQKCWHSPKKGPSSPAEAGESLEERRSFEAQGLLFLTTWHECWAFLALMSIHNSQDIDELICVPGNSQLKGACLILTLWGWLIGTSDAHLLWKRKLASLICVSHFVAYGNNKRFTAICWLFLVCLPCNLHSVYKIIVWFI